MLASLILVPKNHVPRERIIWLCCCKTFPSVRCLNAHWQDLELPNGSIGGSLELWERNQHVDFEDFQLRSMISNRLMILIIINSKVIVLTIAFSGISNLSSTSDHVETKCLHHDASFPCKILKNHCHLRWSTMSKLDNICLSVTMFDSSTCDLFVWGHGFVP